MMADPSVKTTKWPAHAAAVWAFVFGAMSFYWAAGGEVGSSTIGPAITDRARDGDTAFIAVIWLTGVLKVIGGLVALALVQRWGRAFPSWLLLAAAGGGGSLAILYGAASWVQHGLMLSGAVNLPEGLGRTAAWWHLLFWDPFWVAGGLLFVLAACFFRRAAEKDVTPHTRQEEGAGPSAA